VDIPIGLQQKLAAFKSAENTFRIVATSLPETTEVEVEKTDSSNRRFFDWIAERPGGERVGFRRWNGILPME